MFGRPLHKNIPKIEKCEELTAIDERCMEDIVKGRSIEATFAEHRVKTV